MNRIKQHKFIWMRIIAIVFCATSVELYYHFIRGVSLVGNITSLITGIIIVAVLLEIFFLHVKRQRDRLKKEIERSKKMEGVLKESEERHRAYFDQAPDSMLMVNPENAELVQFNDKAFENLGYSKEEFSKIKIPDFEVIESTEDVEIHLEKMLREGGDVFSTRHRKKSGEIRDILVSSKVITVSGKKLIQSICRDITEQLVAEKEREDLIRQLQDALREIKKLSGLLPICLSCKKIRDDQGYWSEVEEYIGKHSEAEFSHGFCPDCLHKLHPKVYDKLNKKDPD